MSDFEWPAPVPFVEPAVGPARRGLTPGEQHRADVARHREHGEHGDPDCPMCVFTTDGFQTSNCRSCTTPIIWAITTDLNRMPVDATPDPDGNLVLGRGPAGVVTVTVLDQASLFDDGIRRKSHFATCPDANGWRKTR